MYWIVSVYVDSALRADNIIITQDWRNKALLGPLLPGDLHHSPELSQRLVSLILQGCQ